MKQLFVAELKEATFNVLNGGDPLSFVNAFMKCPLEAPAFPRKYWEKRVCAVAEMLAELGTMMEEKLEPCEKRRELIKLRKELDAQGGRDIWLAERIDDIACELGDCVYTFDECGRATHPSEEEDEDEDDDDNDDDLLCRPDGGRDGSGMLM